jgi:hypothetical protein
MSVAEGFEQISAHGVQCMICGATVQPIGELTNRHRDWHKQIDQAIAQAAQTPTSEQINRDLWNMR